MLASSGESTPPTHFAMFTLRVGVGVVVGALAEWDAVSDGDLLGSDEDVFDKQPQDPLTFLNGGELDLGVQLAEEAFEIGGEVEVGLTVGELVVERLDLVAQVGLLGAQVGHAGPQLVDAEQLFGERLDQAGDAGAGFGQRGVEPFPFAGGGSAVRALANRLSISARISCGSASRPMM